MSDDTKDAPDGSGERIAKRIARAGAASRREAERLIDAGRVTLNGEVIRSPAIDVGPDDTITIDGTPLPKAERTRLWRYHKPPGLLVSRTDPRGRRTIYMELPPELKRAISVGRLDFNSEGLLLLTNDGELSRQLELPTAGLERRYRARAFGHVDQKALDRLAKGITVDGVRYGPIQATLEEARGANAWIGLTLTEGKNREVRNVLRAVGLHVNRLIRTSYGPFQLGDMPPGAVAEVPAASLMRDLGVATQRPKGWAKAKPKLKQRPGKNARLASRKPSAEPKNRERPNADRPDSREHRPEHRPGDRRPSGNRRGAGREDAGGKITRIASTHADANRPNASHRDGEPIRDRRDPERSHAPRADTPPHARPQRIEHRGPVARDERRGDTRSGAPRPNADRQNVDRPGAQRRDGHRPGPKPRDDRAPDARPAAKRPFFKRRDDDHSAPPRHGEKRSGADHRPSRPRDDRPNTERRDDNRSGPPRHGDHRGGADHRPPRPRDDRPNADRSNSERRNAERSGPARHSSAPRDNNAVDKRPRTDRPDGGRGGPKRSGPNRSGSERSGPRGPHRGPNADRRR